METLPLVLFAILSQIQQVLVSSVQTPVFVLKDQDVLLDVKEQVDMKTGDFLSWTFNSSAIIVKYNHGLNFTTVKETYRNKAVFSEDNFSLHLKSLQKADSGSYVANMIGDTNIVVASYLISVLESVNPPVLTLDSVSSSVESCNLTVTCNTTELNTSITSTVHCYNQTCSQGGGGTSTAPLYIYLSGGSIICHHSNQVSWRNDTKERATLCSLKPGPKPWPYVIIGIIVGILLLGLVFIVCIVLRFKQKMKGKKEITNSTYETVQTAGRAADQGSMSMSMSVSQVTESSGHPTIYSTVQHPRPEVPGAMEMTPSTIPLPESIYAQVDKKTNKQ